MDKPILVIGGTRGTGRLIVEKLTERGHAVRVLARRPAEARRSLPDSVELIPGDLIRPETLAAAVHGAEHIVFTAGVHSGRIASETQVRCIDYDGVVHTIRAACAEHFAGRFVYLNSAGVMVPSAAASLVNLLKRNTLVWRRRVECELRASPLDYTIIRVGFLSNRQGGRRQIRMSQQPLPLAPRNRIARSDAAEVFVKALREPRASRVTFDVIWGEGARQPGWEGQLERLIPDD